MAPTPREAMVTATPREAMVTATPQIAFSPTTTSFLHPVGSIESTLPPGERGQWKHS